MYSARFFILILTLSLLSFSTPLTLIHAQPEMIPTDLSGLSHDKEIIIPIDTSLPNSIYQPIDTRITFEESCWAKNETIHSIRAAYYDGNDYTEIESQIYDLSYEDDTHIDSCSLVFLIPTEATGEETYHVFYSSSETSSPEYPNHISVEDTHYFYEPITGQIMDFDYYQISEDENVIYGICQKGELLGNGMSNTIIKLLPNSKQFASKNAEQIVGFTTSYSIDPPGEHIGTQLADDITKSVLVNGNLMTRIRIIGASPDDALLTDNIYTYYYNPDPTLTKKLMVNVNHQTLKDVEVQGTMERDGTLASITTIKARSGTIDDMNIGEILPKIHFYNEDGNIIDYDMPTDPDADPADWLLGYSDDQDLGDRAWLCIDDPDTGRAHGLIFESNTGFFEGDQDGIQVKASVHQHVKLPGLEADSGDIYALRNAYENGEHITSLKEGENIIFNVEYLALQSGGYELIDQESTIFQQLIKECPLKRGNESIEEEPGTEVERYSLKTTILRAFSAPLGSLLSAALGKNISYLTAELHSAKTLISSGSVGRLKINSLDIEFEDDANLIQKIQGIANLFDFKNSTLLKTITFKDVEPGTYLIKIYKENPRRQKERQFIGFTVVEVSEDTSTYISCRSQSTVELTATDQNEKAIENAETVLLFDDVIISKDSTDSDGYVILPLPAYTNKEFTLRTIYDGFQVHEESVSLNLLNRLRPWTSTFSINRHNLKINVKDNLGLPPGIDTRPMMKSQEMTEQTSINAEETGEGTYQFTELFEANYDIILSYKSWEYTESISLTNDKAIDIVFPAEFSLETITLNKIGNNIDSAEIMLERDGKRITGTIDGTGKGTLMAPPGEYLLSINKDESPIVLQKVTIKGDKSLDLVSSLPSAIHELLPIILVILGGIGTGLWFWKKKEKQAVLLLLTFILLSSIILPWWHLQGDNASTETISETYLYPPTLITRTESRDIIGGEISEVPEIFTTVLTILSIFVIITSLLIFSGLFINKKFPKITLILSIIALIFLILNIALFYITMSEVTKIGIGDFFGSGDLSISLPGESSQVAVSANWGAGFGIYALVIVFIGFFIVQFLPIIQQKIIRKRK